MPFFSGARCWKLHTAIQLLLSLTFVTQAAVVTKRNPDDELADIALENAYKILDGELSDGSTHTPACTRENVVVRKEYGDMTKSERLDYTRAVNCLLNRPSRLDPELYPGAKNRYDDFVVVHMNMTPSVHATANFLHWHRYYVWAYEYALQTECSYEGTQPYWNWGKYEDPTTSPIFNGDDYSMSGNGEFIPHEGHVIGRGGILVPPGNGGGCVKTGPFKNMTVNLGPRVISIDPALNVTLNPRADGYAYNPRCLRRDVNKFFTSQYLRPIDIANSIRSTDDIDVFQTSLQTDTAQAFGLHSGGHYSIWGDPGGDFYVSPAEPAFWLHHGQVDRHWWIWQNQDPENRVQQYKGGTLWNTTNSPPGHIDDLQYLSIVSPDPLVDPPSRDLVSSTAGPFCYIYV